MGANPCSQVIKSCRKAKWPVLFGCPRTVRFGPYSVQHGASVPFKKKQQTCLLFLREILWKVHAPMAWYRAWLLLPHYHPSKCLGTSHLALLPCTQCSPSIVIGPISSCWGDQSPCYVISNCVDKINEYPANAYRCEMRLLHQCARVSSRLWLTLVITLTDKWGWRSYSTSGKDLTLAGAQY